MPGCDSCNTSATSCNLSSILVFLHADEAHRTHGSNSMDMINQLLSSPLVSRLDVMPCKRPVVPSGCKDMAERGRPACDGPHGPSTDQHAHHIYYIGLTATPSEKALMLFGVSCCVASGRQDTSALDLRAGLSFGFQVCWALVGSTAALKQNWYRAVSWETRSCASLYVSIQHAPARTMLCCVGLIRRLLALLHGSLRMALQYAPDWIIYPANLTNSSSHTNKASSQGVNL